MAPSILLLKAQTTNSPISHKGDELATAQDYTKPLSDLGCQIHYIPVLQFHFSHIEMLVKSFTEVERFRGIILTSPRSVEACQMAFDLLKDKSILQRWTQSKQCYAVGPSTAQKAHEQLNWHIDQIRGGESCGNSESLAHCILHDCDKMPETGGKEQNLLLYPCGNLKRDTLGHILEKSKYVRLHSITCYETIAHTELSKNIETLNKDCPKLDMVVFFSPSGVKYSWEYLKAHFDPFPRCIAIGPTTMSSIKLKFNGSGNVIQSDSPSACGVVAAVKQILNDL